MSKRSRPGAVRVLHLVRHGQYESGELGSGKLTALGRTQALRLARKFEALPVESIVSSDLVRAVETAQILAEQLGMTRPKRIRLLREVLPSKVPGFRVPIDKRVKDALRVERIVERFFKASRRTKHQVIVCHGNLIRALLLRVTSGRLDGWYRLPTHHVGVTSFAISRSGIRVTAFDVIEHLPARMRTRE